MDDIETFIAIRYGTVPANMKGVGDWLRGLPDEVIDRVVTNTYLLLKHDMDKKQIVSYMMVIGGKQKAYQAAYRELVRFHSNEHGI